MTRDDFRALAWAAFVEWAAAEQEIRAAFTAETGLPFLAPPETPIEAMIDTATGADGNAEAFVEWVTRNHWGLEEAPEAYRNSLAEVGP